MSDKRLHEFLVAGMPYKIRTSHDEQTVQELVTLVDSKIKSAMSSIKSGSFQSAAVLAALNIAEELVLLKRKAYKELEILEQKALKLSEDLETSHIKNSLEN
jgi:cell division protein ZapA